MIIGMEKSLKTVMLTWTIQVSVTLLPMHLLIFLRFITQSIWSSEFKILSPIRYLE